MLIDISMNGQPLTDRISYIGNMIILDVTIVGVRAIRAKSRSGSLVVTIGWSNIEYNSVSYPRRKPVEVI